MAASGILLSPRATRDCKQTDHCGQDGQVRSAQNWSGQVGSGRVRSSQVRSNQDRPALKINGIWLEVPRRHKAPASSPAAQSMLRSHTALIYDCSKERKLPTSLTAIKQTSEQSIHRLRRYSHCTAWLLLSSHTTMCNDCTKHKLPRHQHCN